MENATDFIGGVAWRLYERFSRIRAMVTAAVTRYQREHGDVRSTQCPGGAAGTTALSLQSSLSVDRVLQFYLPLHLRPYALSVQARMLYYGTTHPSRTCHAASAGMLYHEHFVNVSELGDSVRACHSAF